MRTALTWDVSCVESVAGAQRVVDLYFDVQADRALTVLEADVTRSQLAERIRVVLDALADDSSQAWLRRHRFQIGLWGVSARGSAEDWIVLWEPYPETDDAVIVQYIGPAAFG